MRVNVYAEEMPNDIEKGVVLFEKTVDGGGTFTALRFYLHLPVTQDDNCGAPPGVTRQIKGPFMHHPGDDDSAAVTFWGKKDMRPMLRRALALLDAHEARRAALPLVGSSGPADAPTATDRDLTENARIAASAFLTETGYTAPQTAEAIAQAEHLDRVVSNGVLDGRMTDI